MNKSTRRPRRYASALRSESAEATKAAILKASRDLFGRHGVDKVTVAAIATKAAVSPSTVYSLFESKEGILRELMRASIFGSRFQSAQSLVVGLTDPIRLVAMTAKIARAIYESETAELGLLRGISAFSPSLRKLENEFENIRFEMQEERLKTLSDSGKLMKTLTLAEARRVMWMYTSRDVYRMLVQVGGWTPDRYEQWLSDTLVNALVKK